MFRPADIVIEALLQRVSNSYAELFPLASPEYRAALLRACRIGATHAARTDALYHNLDHTVQVVCVGVEMLKGKMLRDGDLDAHEAMHFVAALLLFAIGFNRRLLPEDHEDRAVIQPDGTGVDLPDGATDAFLRPYAAERGMMFVRSHFGDSPIIDADLLADYIDYTRFPPCPDRQPDLSGFRGLVRAARLIGMVSDPYFMKKLKPLTLEFQESGMLGQLGVADVVEFRANYVQLFWNTLNPLICEGMELLEFTNDGRDRLASMRLHLLREEHLNAIHRRPTKVT
jgi:hypothetical protein